MLKISKKNNYKKSQKIGKKQLQNVKIFEQTML